jgi:CubicO group peptidase (beta-lactamase class C family)
VSDSTQSLTALEAASPEDLSAACRAIRRMVEPLTGPSGLSPAIAVVAVTAAEIPLLFVDGLANHETAAPATADTPFYLASQTKSYVGLLAALLDGEGILPLDRTLSEVWPDLVLPKPVRPAAITMRHLLTHQLPLANDELVLKTSYEEQVGAEDCPKWLAASAVRRPGFQYDNLGYIVYAAALERMTGISWKDWVQERLLKPLGLSRTSARTSAFDLSELAWRHRRHANGWQALPPKADMLMHAAGGLVSSPADIAKWMQANLRRSGGDIPTMAFTTAQTAAVVDAKIEGDFEWTGYALGQQVGTVAGVAILGHRGGYEGARSITIICPAKRVGFAAAVNADAGTRELLDGLTTAFFGSLMGDRSAEGDLEKLRRTPGNA